jgi:hypothetical protein
MFGSQRISSTVLGTLAVAALLSTSVLASSAIAASTSLRRAAGSFRCDRIVAFDSSNFSDPTTIDNQYFPLVPGTRSILEGTADIGNGPLPHNLVLTVTDLTKIVDGVRARVIWETDTNGGQLVESELAFLAQDDEGNVWNVGELPEEFENGVSTGAPSTWVAGLSDAEAGIRMPASPLTRTPWYLQASVPSIEFLDCAKYVRKLDKRCVPFDCFTNILVIKEDNPLEPGGGYQRKFYAPDVGGIQVKPVNDPEGETLDLVDSTQLSPDALAQARQEVLALDARGCQLSPVYCDTAPAG